MTFDQFCESHNRLTVSNFIFDAKLRIKLADAEPCVVSFVTNVWPKLSQFRGFVKRYMHLLDEDMTPQVELQLLAWSQSLDQSYYPNLKLKPIGTFFDVIPSPLPLREPPSSPLSRAKNHEITITNAPEVESKETSLEDIQCTVLSLAITDTNAPEVESKETSLEDIQCTVLSLEITDTSAHETESKETSLEDIQQTVLGLDITDPSELETKSNETSLEDIQRSVLSLEKDMKEQNADIDTLKEYIKLLLSHCDLD